MNTVQLRRPGRTIMTAQDLIEKLTHLASENDVALDEINIYVHRPSTNILGLLDGIDISDEDGEFSVSLESNATIIAREAV